MFLGAGGGALRLVAVLSRFVETRANLRFDGDDERSAEVDAPARDFFGDSVADVKTPSEFA